VASVNKLLSENISARENSYSSLNSHRRLEMSFAHLPSIREIGLRTRNGLNWLSVISDGVGACI
jgi:hypothetical protein